MDVKMTLNAEKMEKEDLRAFIQMIREWELRTPKSTIVGILFNTKPELSSSEAEEIFRGIFPEFKNIVNVPHPVEPGEELKITVVNGDTNLARLGQRVLVADGVLLGTVDELSLTIGKATAEELQKLRDAESIQLVRVRKG